MRGLQGTQGNKGTQGNQDAPGSVAIANQIFSGSASTPSAAINRRKFTQTVLASLPAASLACALPATGSGQALRPGADQEFVCVIQVLIEMPDFAVYLAMNCATQETWTYADIPGIRLGNCSNPVSSRCMTREFFDGLARTDDVLKIVLSPDLSRAQLEKIDLFRSALLMNMT